MSQAVVKRSTRTLRSGAVLPSVRSESPLGPLPNSTSSPASTPGNDEPSSKALGKRPERATNGLTDPSVSEKEKDPKATEKKRVLPSRASRWAGNVLGPGSSVVDEMILDAQKRAGEYIVNSQLLRETHFTLFIQISKRPTSPYYRTVLYSSSQRTRPQSRRRQRSPMRACSTRPVYSMHAKRRKSSRRRNSASYPKMELWEVACELDARRFVPLQLHIYDLDSESFFLYAYRSPQTPPMPCT